VWLMLVLLLSVLLLLMNHLGMRWLVSLQLLQLLFLVAVGMVLLQQQLLVLLLELLLHPLLHTGRASNSTGIGCAVAAAAADLLHWWVLGSFKPCRNGLSGSGGCWLLGGCRA